MTTRRKRRGLIWLLVLLLISALFADLVLLARDHRLLLQKVAITGLQTISEPEVQAQVEQVLAGDYGYFWPRRNALLYSKSEIIKNLQEKFPALLTITLTQTDFNTLNLNLTERRGEYVWCGASGAPCYLLDQSGFAFAPAPQISGPAFLTFVTVATSSLATRLLPSTAFSQLLNLIILINQNLLTPVKLANYKVTKTDLLDDGELRLTASNGNLAADFLVLINQNENSSELAPVLAAAINAPTFVQDLASSTLDYLDLRFPGKVYYKLKS